MRLPLVSSQELIKAMSKIGYYPIRQRGSHIRLQCAERPSITIPNYKTIDKSLLKENHARCRIGFGRFDRAVGKIKRKGRGQFEIYE